MVTQVQRDGTDWFECETCGMLFEVEQDAEAHEENCTGEEPDYLQ